MTADGWLVTGIISTLTFSLGVLIPTAKLKGGIDVNAKDIDNIKKDREREEARGTQERAELLSAIRCVDEKLDEIRKVVYALNGRRTGSP